MKLLLKQELQKSKTVASYFGGFSYVLENWQSLIQLKIF